jgi:hypothetical protein
VKGGKWKLGRVRGETGACLVESTVNGAVECSAYYFSRAMDGCGGGFYGICSLL